jgi:glycosyltransferase involved in cell wall biosynthesis
LSIPESAFVLGHVGRMVPEKNHAFLIDLAADLCRRLPEAYLLLVGDGSMRHRLEDQVRSLGLTQKVLFTGFRDDIAEILQGAMDLFLFPSSYESAGMALVEAQAAGLPCLITDTIPEEVVIIPELVERASLNDGPRGWAEAILANWKHKASLNPIEAVARLRGTLFDLEANVSYLQELYSTVLSCRPHVSER